MVHVPYKGTSASVTDLLGGQIPLVIGAATALEPLARAGSIKLLGVTSAQRFAPLPDVPAIGETFAGFDIISYMGLMVPRSTPPNVVAALNREVNRVLAEPDMRSWMLTQGMVVAGGTPDDFKRQIDANYRGDHPRRRTDRGITGGSNGSISA